MRLVAENLSAERGGETVFSGVDFALQTGEMLVVTGPNGSGKSTLLRVMAGLLPHTAGAVRLEGGGERWADAAMGAHYLGHQNAMKSALSVAENLRFWQHFLGTPHLDIAEALDLVGLHAIGHLPFGYLSTGQRRRVSIARLLISHRPVWLLDEPTSGLDKASERRTSELIEAHRGSGGMVVAATHLPLGVEGTKELRMGHSSSPLGEGREHPC